MCERSGALYMPGRASLLSCIPPIKQGYVAQFDAAFLAREGSHPSHHSALCYNLSDDPKNRLCWSAASDKIPTYRKGKAYMWFPAAGRWMTRKEAMATMGWPVYGPIAELYGCDVVDGTYDDIGQLGG